MNEQQNFWANTYADEYIKKNNQFDRVKGVVAWKKMLEKAGQVTSLLECGCNIGRNIDVLNVVLPDARKSVIEISQPAFTFVTKQHKLDQTFNGAIVDAMFDEESFDLVYTMGVLIHIHPDNLLDNMNKMYTLSSNYILIGEYFNRTPVMLEYQGQKDRLFKRDFGRLFLQNFSVELVDYGFLWGEIYDDAGFDDTTWWLFKKK